VVTRVLLVGAGSLITVAGVVFALQGVGVIGGSFMSGTTTWAVAGPLIALAGLALIVLGLRRRLSPHRRLQPDPGEYAHSSAASSGNLPVAGAGVQGRFSSSISSRIGIP